MKQSINLGNQVDDSSGDYLRQGAQKINSNFADVYSELGDGTELHPAGAWKTHSHQDGDSLFPALGAQYNINSLSGPVSITLPKGSAEDYGRVISIRDAHSSWGTNSVTIKPSSGDSVGGSTNSVVFSSDFTTLEFVYSSPATWRYVSGLKLDSLPRAEGAGVIVKSYRVDSTTIDGVFTNIGVAGYNAAAVQVYRNGVLLTYDPTLVNSDYGSVSGTPGELYPLNGVDIYIPYVILDDVVTIITYSKDVSASPVSYIRYDALMLDPLNPEVPVPGQTIQIKSSGTYTLQDFGRPRDEEFNPSAFELRVNGTLLVQNGRAGLVPGIGDDYILSTDLDGRWNTFTVTPVLEDSDIVTLIYFNNELGSIIEWLGTDGIKERVSDSFLNSEYRFNRSKKIRYTDTQKPSATTAVTVPGTEANIRFENVIQFLESIYPVGSIYMNANNSANPVEYMGFGTWQPYSKGRAIFGFNDTLDSLDNPDPIFGINTKIWNDDEQRFSRVAGNEVGDRQVEIKSENLPALVSDRKYLRESQSGSGDINLSGCIPELPEGTDPLMTFELALVDTNTSGEIIQDPVDLPIIPPGITAYIWVRTS